MATINPKIEASWYEVLKEEFESDYFLKLKNFLLEEKKQHIIYPKSSHIFEAFNRCSFNDTRVVIIGQDPYHGPNQAHGLCFSVQNGVKIPPSLLNIFKELKAEFNYPIPNHGNLSSWADQGVLLLNAILSVRASEAGSHRKKGWEQFSDRCISELSIRRKNLVFLLWGRFAQEKAVLIDQSKHLILKAAHPSPLSAYNGFFGCEHFKKANDYLISKSIKAINWEL